MDRRFAVNAGEILLKPVDGLALGLFRVFWGLLMCLEANWLHNQLRDLHHPEVLHFHHQGFSWVRHFPEGWMMELEMVAMLLAAILVALGQWFRPAAFVLSVTYAHFFFAEALAYNNHFYLIVLVNFLLLFTQADRRCSVRAWVARKGGRSPGPVPNWNYLVLQFQAVIVYFYGGVAKLNRDWLVEMEPVRFWLRNSPRPPEWLAWILRQDWFVPFTAWGGLLIDLICPFLLFFMRTRLVAIVVLVLFHGINSQIFNIGYFPLMGVLLILPFLPPHLGGKAKPSALPQDPLEGMSVRRKRVLLGLLAGYVLFQILFPLRWHLWRPAEPLWTEKGQRFAWRMMLREKIDDFQICFADPEIQAWFEQRPGLLPRLAPSAGLRLGQNPYFIWQYVQAVKRVLSDYGKGDAAIHVFATCSLNGRPYHPLVDPNIDLAAAECPFLTIPDWIVPLPDLKVDFGQIQPIEDKRRFSEEAMERWLAKNPGPAVDIFKRYRMAAPPR